MQYAANFQSYVYVVCHSNVNDLSLCLGSYSAILSMLFAWWYTIQIYFIIQMSSYLNEAITQGRRCPPYLANIGSQFCGSRVLSNDRMCHSLAILLDKHVINNRADRMRPNASILLRITTIATNLNIPYAYWALKWYYRHSYTTKHVNLLLIFH